VLKAKKRPELRSWQKRGRRTTNAIQSWQGKKEREQGRNANGLIVGVAAGRERRGRRKNLKLS